jgi:hypothetical protein
MRRRRRAASFFPLFELEEGIEGQLREQIEYNCIGARRRRLVFLDTKA